MKLLTFFLLLISTLGWAQADQAPVVVNISDDAVLQYNGAFVKRKATVVNYQPIISTTKDFYLKINIAYYVNNGGAYGALILQDIASNVNLTADQKVIYNQKYANSDIDYFTQGQWTDVNGNTVSATTPGAITDLQYWQTFKLNQIPGMGTLATQSAAGVQYLIVIAVVNKLDIRKKF